MDENEKAYILDIFASCKNHLLYQISNSFNRLAVCLFCPPALIVPGGEWWFIFTVYNLLFFFPSKNRDMFSHAFFLWSPLHRGDKNNMQQPWGTIKAIYIFNVFFFFVMYNQTVTNNHCIFFWVKTVNVN